MTTVTIRQDFQIGERATFTKTITGADVNALADLIGDHNPVHMDEAFAAQTRFGRRIAHGVFTAGLISAALGNELPGPGAIYLSQEIQFKAPVYLGDTVTAVVEVTAWRPDKRIITLKTDCYNQDEKLVATGQAVLLVERPRE